jgi:protein O-GlcNAc transferase
MLFAHSFQQFERFVPTTALLTIGIFCLTGCSPTPSQSLSQSPPTTAAEELKHKSAEAQSQRQISSSDAADHGLEHEANDAAIATSVDPAAELPPATALELRQEATALAEELVDRFPNDADALEIKARFLMLFGETQAAKECWLKAVRLIPDYGYGLYGLGKIALLESDYEQAIDLFNRSIPKQPGVAEPVHDLADAYTKLSQLDKAIESLRSFATANPHSALTWLLLGQAAQSKLDYEQAEQAFRTALELAPGTFRAEQGLATVLIRLGKREEAKKLLAEARAKEPAATKNRSAEQVFQDELKECSARFLGVAEFYMSKRELNAATRVARRALVLDPQSVKAKSTLSNLYQQQGQLPAAIALLRELRQAEPLNASWPFTLGVLLANNGDLTAAAEQYREVIRLAPQNPIGYEALTRLVIGQGKDVKQVIEVTQQLVKLRGTAADHELLAEAYALTADYTQAERSLREAIRLDPNNSLYLQAMNQLQKVLGGAHE